MNGARGNLPRATREQRAPQAPSADAGRASSARLKLLASARSRPARTKADGSGCLDAAELARRQLGDGPRGARALRGDEWQRRHPRLTASSRCASGSNCSRSTPHWRCASRPSRAGHARAAFAWMMEGHRRPRRARPRHRPSPPIRISAAQLDGAQTCSPNTSTSTSSSATSIACVETSLSLGDFEGLRRWEPPPPGRPRTSSRSPTSDQRAIGAGSRGRRARGDRVEAGGGRAAEGWRSARVQFLLRSDAVPTPTRARKGRAGARRVHAEGCSVGCVFATESQNSAPLSAA